MAYPLLYTSIILNDKYRAQHAAAFGDMLDRFVYPYCVLASCMTLHVSNDFLDIARGCAKAVLSLETGLTHVGCTGLRSGGSAIMSLINDGGAAITAERCRDIKDFCHVREGTASSSSFSLWSRSLSVAVASTPLSCSRPAEV